MNLEKKSNLENFNRKLEIRKSEKRGILKLQKHIAEIRISIDGFNIRLDAAQRELKN